MIWQSQFVTHHRIMTNNSRVLILYASGGMGHVTAARAVAAAFRAVAPEIQIETRNVLDFAHPVFRFGYEDGYNFISAHAIGLWGRLYRRYNQPGERQRLLHRLTRWGVEPRLRAFLAQYQPSYILGTHPMPLRVIANFRPGAGATAPMGMVITDFGCHRYWIEPAVKRYFVANDDVKACVVGLGVPAERILATGIPIDPKFSRPAGRAEARQQLGMDPALPALLVVGGLITIPYLETLIRGIRQRVPCQFLIVAGRDSRLQRRLASWPMRRAPNIFTFGFVDNLEVLMASADVILTKAGGLTVSECLALGLPLAVGNVIAGQEEDNLNFVLHRGVAVRSQNALEMARALTRLLLNPESLARMKARCRELGQPRAATAIVESIVAALTAPT